MNTKRQIALGLPITVLLLAHCIEDGSARPKLKEKEQGQALYMSNCEACHMMGKNVIKPEKELIKSSKLQSERLFREYLAERHGVMPEFPEITKKDESIQALYRFVKTLKNQSWEYKTPDEPDEDEPQSGNSN